MHAEELVAFDSFHCSPVDADGVMLTPLFSQVPDQLLGFADVEGEAVSNLLPPPPPCFVYLGQVTVVNENLFSTGLPG